MLKSSSFGPRDPRGFARRGGIQLSFTDRYRAQQARAPGRNAMKFTNRLLAASAALAALALAAPQAPAQTSGPPVKIGSTLALTGPLAATGLVHKVVGEIYVDQLNAGKGLLGRPVEWVLKDDQSKPDLARTLYEQLLTVDKVDLFMGPYATGAILSAMSVA